MALLGPHGVLSRRAREVRSQQDRVTNYGFSDISSLTRSGGLTRTTVAGVPGVEGAGDTSNSIRHPSTSPIEETTWT
jgi:hypothetical protein